MARTPDALTDSELAFLAEPRLATLTTLRPDGSPHVTAMAFSYDPATHKVRMITRASSAKVCHVEATSRVVVGQVDGARWLALEGEAVVCRDDDRIRAAVTAHEQRYRPATPRPDRVAIEFQVLRVLGSA